MRRTLEMTVIEGIKTSIPLHLRILNDPDFVAGKLEHLLHGAVPGAPAARRPSRRSGLGRPARSTLPPLYVICDADVVRSAPAGRSSTSPSACLRRRRARCSSSAPSSAAGGELLDRRREAVVARAQQAGALRDRQRSRGHRAAGRRRRRARRPGRPAAAAVRRDRRATHAWSGCRRTRSRRSTRRSIEPVDYLAIGPVFGTATKDTGYDAVGLERVRSTAARPRRSAAHRRSWRSAASRSTRAPSVIARRRAARSPSSATCSRPAIRRRACAQYLRRCR